MRIGVDYTRVAQLPHRGIVSPLRPRQARTDRAARRCRAKALTARVDAEAAWDEVAEAHLDDDPARDVDADPDPRDAGA